MLNGLGNNFLGQNSIANFNKVFEQHLQSIDKGLDQANLSDFDSILNQKTNELETNIHKPLRTGIEVNAGWVNIPNLDLSLNASESAKVHHKSEVEKSLNHFGESFADGIRGINAKQMEAEHAVETLASGGDISVHEVMIAAEKASLSMQMGLQLRNKILAAYNELYNVRM